MAMDSPAASGTSIWTWRYGDVEGRPVPMEVWLAAGTPPQFPAQADAESWVGEDWGRLLAAGVDSVSLELDGTDVYGPMSLHPAAD